MIPQIRDAFVNILEEQRESQSYCLVRWIDNKRIDIVSEQSIYLLPSETIKINSTYIVNIIDGSRRQATVLANGTKKECENVWHRLSPDSAPSSAKSTEDKADVINDLILIRILNSLLDKAKTRRGETTDEDVHNVECSICGAKPLSQTDRYRCLECSTSSSGFDVCGHCFEKRRQSDQHQLGHAVVHFKLPNEFLGIEVIPSHKQLNLEQLKNYSTLQNEYHSGITCDGECGRKNFTGLRFKCDTCPNYNLCERCAIERRAITKNHRRDHPIVLASDRTMPKISPSDIELGEILGRGGFGYVAKARWIPKNRQAACKVIEVSGFSETAKQLKQSFLAELAAYRELSGPYIVRTFGFATQHIAASGARRETEQFMILMEFMHRGSLQNLLEQQPNQISLRRKVTFARQIASGMRRIHEHGMVHRDIRPDNILITEHYVAKIGDMGIARVLDPAGQHTQIGCLRFMPPEFFADSPGGYAKYDQKLDMFTFGLTLNQLFTETQHEFRMIPSSNRIRLKKMSSIFFDEIILPCISNDPNRRPNAEMIENILEIYGQAFRETMQSSAYVRMNASEKNGEFIQFYQKNRSRIQKFLAKKLSESNQNLVEARMPS